MYPYIRPISHQALPEQSSPVDRHAVSDQPRYWFAGGNPNAAQEFREPEDCGCHILSAYAIAGCLAACRSGLMV